MPGHPESAFDCAACAALPGMEEVKPQDHKLDREVTARERHRAEVEIQTLRQELAALAAAGAVNAARLAAIRLAEDQWKVERATLEADRAGLEAQLQATNARWQAEQDQFSVKLDQLSERLKQRHQFAESLTVCLVSAMGLLKDAEAEDCECSKRRKLAENVIESYIRADDSDDSMPPSQDRNQAAAR